MSRYYTPYELVQRLDSIPSVNIHSFSEIVEENGVLSAEIKIHFPNEFDETAYEHLEEVMEEAPNWTLNQPDNPSEEITKVNFRIDADLPLALLEKYDLA